MYFNHFINLFSLEISAILLSTNSKFNKVFVLSSAIPYWVPVSLRYIWTAIMRLDWNQERRKQRITTRHHPPLPSHLIQWSYDYIGNKEIEPRRRILYDLRQNTKDICHSWWKTKRSSKNKTKFGNGLAPQKFKKLRLFSRWRKFSLGHIVKSLFLTHDSFHSARESEMLIELNS